MININITKIIDHLILKMDYNVSIPRTYKIFFAKKEELNILKMLISKDNVTEEMAKEILLNKFLEQHGNKQYIDRFNKNILDLEVYYDVKGLKCWLEGKPIPINSITIELIFKKEII